MPPTRSIPPAKAVKTERTHEENQERAYIAASRRSDRSLEARVESARRASEIHKRRTGRSLRVTEQDVINEEMYEEEDDDLPLQYRRLTAHLQTGSADFNRRLAAYLTNQVAMRSAMEQMVNTSYGPQHGYPNVMSPYGQQRPNMFQSPMVQQQQQQQMSQSPTTGYRQAPYPSPHQAGFRQSHGRAYSTAVVSNKVTSPPAPLPASLEHRRMSTPASIHPINTSVDANNIKADPDYMRQSQSANMPLGQFPPLWQDMGPFTTSLPPESQQMLAGAPALDPNDPFTAMLMQGSERFTNNQYYPWGDMQQGIKGMPVHPSAYQGMSATLAPAAIDSHSESLSATPSTVAPTTQDGMTGDSIHMKRSESYQSLQSGQVTPGESFWNNFVQDGGWSEDALSNN